MQGSYYNQAYSNLQQYVVKQNDSLYMIAKKYNITVDQLKNANHLVSNMIYPNQVLFIPKVESKSSTYVTQSGDSVQKIIDKFQLELGDISQQSNLGNLKIEADQLLKVNPRGNEKVHTVMPGETIEDILARYQLSPLDFLKLNEKNFIMPNTKVIIEK